MPAQRHAALAEACEKTGITPEHPAATDRQRRTTFTNAPPARSPARTSEPEPILAVFAFGSPVVSSTCAHGLLLLRQMPRIGSIASRPLFERCTWPRSPSTRMSWPSRMTWWRPGPGDGGSPYSRAIYGPVGHGAADFHHDASDPRKGATSWGRCRW